MDRQPTRKGEKSDTSHILPPSSEANGLATEAFGPEAERAAGDGSTEGGPAKTPNEFEAAMLAARRLIEASAEKNHPLTDKQLKAVQEAVRNAMTRRDDAEAQSPTRDNKE